MSVQKITIDNYAMDVDTDAKAIAITYQLFTFLSLSSVKANFTNRLSLPLTENNLRNLKMVGYSKSNPSNTRLNLSVSIEQDGNILVSKGTCQIVSVNRKIQVDVQSSAKKIFDLIEGRYVTEIDTNTWNSVWDNDRRDAVRAATSGLVSPVVDSGQLIDFGSGSYVDSALLGSASIPFLYYHTIITKIFELVGYTIQGTILSNNRYLKMVVACQLKYDKEDMDKRCGSGFKDTITVNDPGDGVSRDTTVTFSSIVDNGYGYMKTTKYEIDSNWPATGQMKLKFIITGDVTVKQSTTLKVNAVPITALGQFSIVSIQGISKAQPITVYITAQDGTGAKVNTITNIRFKVEAINSTDDEIMQFTGFVWNYAAALERRALSSYIKDFLKMFGLVMTEKNNVVTFKHISEVLSTLPKKQLSLQSSSSIPEYNFSPKGIAKKNYFKWITQDLGGNSLESNQNKYGEYYLNVVNDTLPDEDVMHESIFSASDQANAKRLTQVAKIDIFRIEQDYDLEFTSPMSKLTVSKFKKTGGVANDWTDASVFSTNGYFIARVSFKVDTGVYFMLGLNSDPKTDNNFTSIDYCWYYSAGTLDIRESGSTVASGIAWVAGDVLEIRYDAYSSTVIYFKNGVAQRTVTNAIRAKMYLDSSFYSAGACADDLYFYGGKFRTIENGLGNRMLLLRDDDGITFRFKDGTTRNDYLIGYFIDKTKTYSLDWLEFKNEFYAAYEYVLNNYVEMRQEFLLDIVTATSIDLTEPQHIQGSNYIVEKIENYVPNKLTKITLIKI